MVRLAHKIHDVDHRIHVCGQGIPQIRIKVSQTRTIDDDVELIAKFFSRLGRQPQAGLRNVAVYDFDFFSQERG